MPPRRAFARLALVLVLAGCAELAPLREPPALESDDPLRGVSTRAEALVRLGPPAEVRASDSGELLVYRIPRVIDRNPARLYGEVSDRLTRYDLLLLHLDPDGRIVRASVEPE